MSRPSPPWPRRGATLLVCVDCGTTSHAPLAEARRLGLDVIVLDHHQAPEQLPDALVVNPNRQDDLSGLGQLCAAGVVFIALIAVNRVLRHANFWSAARPAPDLLTGLDLVALATIADRRAFDRPQPRFRDEGPRPDARARTAGACGAVRCCRRGRPALGASSWVSDRATHQTRAAGSAMPHSAQDCSPAAIQSPRETSLRL